MNFSDHELERYSRQILLPQIGGTGQERLRKASVLVIGAGGLGAPLLQQLAASGVGHVGIVDPDRVDLSNLQRQILYDMTDIGRLKVEAAASRLSSMNPLVKIRTYAFEATDATLDDLVSRYDIICDGTDNFGTRLAVSDACVRQGRTLVAGAVQGFSGQLAVFRPQLGGPCYRCLFPAAEETQAATCAEAGVLGAAAGVMGNLMAVEVMREIIGFEGRDKTQVTMWDALSGTSQRFVLYRDPACRVHADRDLSS